MIINKNKQNKFITFIKKNIFLLSAVLFWLILCLTLNFIIKDIFTTQNYQILNKEKFLMLFFVVLSIALSVFIIIYICRLIYKYIHNVFGSMFRLKLTIFFIFVVLLPIIPLIHIGCQFINASMNIWFSDNFAVAFDESNELIKSYYDEKKAHLYEYSTKFLESMQQNKIKLDKIDEFVKSFYSKNTIFNITVTDNMSKLICEAGSNLWEESAKTKNFENIAYTCTILDKRVFYLDKKDKLYLVMPTKIEYANSNQLIGYINICNEINSRFKSASTNISQSLRNYNIVSLYKTFFVKSFVILFIGCIFPVILVVLIISILISHEIIKPIEKLAETTVAIANEDYQLIDSNAYTDEFISLCNSFNSMIKELQFSRQQLQQQEKIVAWNEISRRFAHEIRNPLTSIQLSMERLLLKYNKKSDDFSDVFDKSSKAILREINRMNQMLTDFSQMSKVSLGNVQIGGIVEILRDSVDLLSINKNNVLIHINPNIQDFNVKRDEVQLKSVFNNILINAIEASSNGDIIEINVEMESVGFTNYALISIADHGTGILSQTDGISTIDIFEPYYSTKCNGTGLGLAICQRTIGQLEGRIYYKTSTEPDNHGTTFFIELPIVENKDIES